MKEIITIEEAMDNKNFDQEFKVITINNNKPISFTKDDYKVVEGEPKYTNAEEKGRSGSATAIISPNTLAIYTSEYIDYPSPKNWSKTIQNMGIYNKSHIIGYSLSAKNAIPDNIFIGTEYLNKITMKSVETELYNDIKDNNRVYLYKVTPKYKQKEDVVPFGILIEAETIDNGEKKQLCKFCYNIQAGIKINYYDGSNNPIEEVYGKREEYKIKTRIPKDENNNKYKEYSINVKTKMFHLFSKKCGYIKNVEPKYIQETKAFEEDIINRGFKLCKKCTNYHKKDINN